MSVKETRLANKAAFVTVVIILISLTAPLFTGMANGEGVDIYGISEEDEDDILEVN